MLSDIEWRDLTRTFCLGDLVSKGPHSERAVDIRRNRCEQVIRGDWEVGITAECSSNPTFHWHRQRLGQERLSYLRNLANTIELELSGQRIRLLHASPFSVDHRMQQRDSVEMLESMFESTDFTGYGFDPDVVGYGDLHTAYLRSIRRKVLFNVGSVGNPLDQPLACYAILEGSPHRSKARPLAITIVRVPYDIERAIREAEAGQMPELELYASALRTAQWRGSVE